MENGFEQIKNSLILQIMIILLLVPISFATNMRNISNISNSTTNDAKPFSSINVITEANNFSLLNTSENASVKTPVDTSVQEASVFEKYVNSLYKKYYLLRIFKTLITPLITALVIIVNLLLMISHVYHEVMKIINLYHSCKPICRFLKRQLCTAMRKIKYKLCRKSNNSDQQYIGIEMGECHLLSGVRVIPE